MVKSFKYGLMTNFDCNNFYLNTRANKGGLHIAKIGNLYILAFSIRGRWVGEVYALNKPPLNPHILSLAEQRKGLEKQHFMLTNRRLSFLSADIPTRCSCFFYVCSINTRGLTRIQNIQLGNQKGLKECKICVLVLLKINFCKQ